VKTPAVVCTRAARYNTKVLWDFAWSRWKIGHESFDYAQDRFARINTKSPKLVKIRVIRGEKLIAC